VFSVNQDEVVPRKEKRQYKKRKHKTGVGAVGIGSHGHGHHHSGRGAAGSGSELLGYNSVGGELLSSEDEGDVVLSGQSPQSEDEEPDPNEGPFTFRRKKYCNYHAVSYNSILILNCNTRTCFQMLVFCC
jgi:enhancer of polycomb-like protein